MRKRVAIFIFMILYSRAFCGVIVFDDPALENAVAQELHTNPPITEIEILDLIQLGGFGIQDLSGVEYATNLTRIRIFAGTITDISSLSGLANLTSLDLEQNKVSDTSALAGLTNLNTLILDENPITDFSGITGLGQLAFLALDDTGMTEIPDLSNLTNLRGLFLGSNAIEDISGLAWLSSCLEIDMLGLVQNQIRDISVLADLTSLHYLNLCGNPLNEDAYSIYIPQIIVNNPGIDIRYDPIPEPGSWVVLGFGGLLCLKQKGSQS